MNQSICNQIFFIYNNYKLLIVFGIIFYATSYSTVESAMFQDPPKPLEVWMDPFPKPNTFERPLFWKAKDFGQWCRNFTMNM